MADHGEFTGYQDGVLFVVGPPTYIDQANYLHLTRHPISIRVCTRCGAIVADEALHDVFHDGGTLT